MVHPCVADWMCAVAWKWDQLLIFHHVVVAPDPLLVSSLALLTEQTIAMMMNRDV